MSYINYDTWAKYRYDVDTILSFARQVNYDMHPVTTLVYRTNVKNSINEVVCGLKNSILKSTIENKIKDYRKNNELEKAKVLQDLLKNS